MNTEELEAVRRRERFKTVLRVYHELKKIGGKVPAHIRWIARDFGLSDQDAKGILEGSYNEKPNLGPTSDDMIAAQRIAA
jgi:hypothetical protein